MDKKVGILIVIIIVVLGLCVGGYFLFFAPKGDEAAELVEYYYSPGDAFITNVTGTTDMLLKVTLTFGTSKDQAEVLKTKNAVLRDTALQVLREATLEELQSTTVQQMLSERICLELNKKFDAANITYIAGAPADGETAPADGETAPADGETSDTPSASAEPEMIAQYIKTPLFTQVYFTDLVMQ